MPLSVRRWTRKHREKILKKGHTRRLRGTRRASVRRAAHGLALLTVLCSQRSPAADDDVVTPSVFGSIHYDSNYFRLPDVPVAERVEGPTVGNQGSAVTRAAGVGLRIDKHYALQEVVVDATVTRYTYSNLSSLDSTAHDVFASYAFKVTPSIGGDVIYRSTAVPADQADTGFTTITNIRTTTLKRLDTDWLAGAALHPRLSVFEESAKSSLPDFQQENSRTRSVSGAMVYTFPSQNTVEAYYRKATGRYEDLLPDPTLLLASSFHEQQSGARLHWVFNGLSTLDADAGYLDRTHPELPARNFSGFVGNLSASYALTGKTRLNLFLSRGLYSSQSDISSFGTDERVNLSAIWSATNKITVVPTLMYVRQSFEGALNPVPIPLREITRSASLEVRWAALRELDVAAIIGHDARAATLSAYQYTNRSAELNARLHF